MSADDIASDARIFSEADVYMICGYLAEAWEVELDSVTEDTEEAIFAVLAAASTGKDAR